MASRGLRQGGEALGPVNRPDMMDEPRTSRVVVVANEEGLHLRAATLLVGLARKFRSRIEVVKDCERADAKSMALQLTALGAAPGDELVLEATGPDAEEALIALTALFANKFQEERTTKQEHVGD